MTNFEYVCKVAAEKGYKVSDASLSKIAGTLNAATGVRTASAHTDLIERMLSQYSENEVQQKKEASNIQGGSSFKQIDASLLSGNCPRCGKVMQDVKLADYTPARYCAGECRITLWKQDNK